MPCSLAGLPLQGIAGLRALTLGPAVPSRQASDLALGTPDHSPVSLPASPSSLNPLPAKLSSKVKLEACEEHGLPSSAHLPSPPRPRGPRAPREVATDGGGEHSSGDRAPPWTRAQPWESCVAALGSPVKWGKRTYRTRRPRRCHETNT